MAKNTEQEQAYAKKAELINLVLSEPDVDLWRLRELALTEGGLVNDDLRRRAWPKLVGLHDRLFEDRKPQPASADTKAAIAAARSPTLPRRKTIETRSNNLDENLPPLPPGLGGESASRDTLPKRRLSASVSDDEHDEHSVTSAASGSSSRDKILAICDDFNQIERDVARCTWHLLTGTQRAVSLQMEHKRHKQVSRLIRRKQRRLANLINLTLQQSYPFLMGDDKLRYFQGYHDVACTILSTLGGSRPVAIKSFASSDTSLESIAASMGLDLPAAVLLQVSQSHFSDCMKANFLQLQTALRLTIFPLLALFDPEVHAHLYQCAMEPFFALSWVITWFSHEIRDTELVKRLFDVFLVSHPLMPVYMSVAMILHPINRQEVIKTECEFALLHQTLQGLPRNSSMVGWKYRPGDGFVSDHEDEDDTVSSAEGLETQDLEADLSLFKNNDTMTPFVEETAPEAVSIESSHLSSLLGNTAPVPFQELIDSAIQYMQRMPPNKLLGLAKRYYGAEQVDQMLSQAPGIALFESPPEWTVLLTAKADWVLQQRAREQRLGVTTRRDRRNGRKRERSRSRSRGPRRQLTDDDDKALINDDDAIQRYLEENVHSPAVIAAGFGSGDDDERRRRKRQRRMMLTGATIAVAVVAVVMGLCSSSKMKPSVGEPGVTSWVMDESPLSPSRPADFFDRGVAKQGSRNLDVSGTADPQGAESRCDADRSWMQEKQTQKNPAQKYWTAFVDAVRVGVQDASHLGVQEASYSGERYSNGPRGGPEPRIQRKGAAHGSSKEPWNLYYLGKLKFLSEWDFGDNDAEKPLWREFAATKDHQGRKTAKQQEPVFDMSSRKLSQEAEEAILQSRLEMLNKQEISAPAKTWEALTSALRRGVSREAEKFKNKLELAGGNHFDPHLRKISKTSMRLVEEVLPALLQRGRGNRRENDFPSDGLTWNDFMEAMRKGIVRSASSLGSHLGELFIKETEVLANRKKQVSLARNLPRWRRISSAIKKGVARKAVQLRNKVDCLKDNMQPQLQRLSKVRIGLVQDIHRRTQLSVLGERAKKLVERLNKPLGVFRQPNIEARLRSLPKNTKRILEDIMLSKFVRELQDVARDLQLSAATETVFLVLRKLGAFTTLRAIIDALRGVLRFRLGKRLTKLEKELEYGPIDLGTSKEAADGVVDAGVVEMLE